ncbi:MAG: PspA/IM30 family protein [Pseudomonadota bacterium]
MFSTLRTLFAASSAAAEERLRDHNAIPLIEQKIRESEAGLRAAKTALAALMQRQSSEVRQAEALTKRIETMTNRAKQALEDGRNELAEEAAAAIANMENEMARRQQTVDHLDSKVMRLRTSVETAHRRIIDLRQGAIQARSLRREQTAQSALTSTLAGQGSMEEAESLIAQVMGQDDPFEQGEFLRDIERDLSHTSLDDRLAGEGYGPATKSTASDVLARLKKS